MNERLDARALLSLRDRVSAPIEARLPADAEGLRWRRIAREDAALLLTLQRSCDAVDAPKSVTTAEEIEEIYDTPGLDLATDTAIAIDEGGAAVAYGMATLGDEHATVVWLSLDGGVHPDRRGEGIGAALLAWLEARGRQILATRDERLPGWLSTGAEEHSTGAIALMHRHGYETKRWWLELERPLHEPLPDVALDPSVRLEPYGEWREATRRAYNEAFRDHWGSQPASEREWVKEERKAGARPDLSFVAVAPGADGAEEVVAFVISEVTPEDWEARGSSFGYIELLGVRKAWRGRGLAPALLVRAMAGFRAEGLAAAVLDVDAESLTGAVVLYERLGFRTVSRSVSLVKEV